MNHVPLRRPAGGNGVGAMLKRLWQSVAFRLALGYGVSVLLFMVVILSVLYVQTIGVMQSRVDRQLRATSARLTEHFQADGREKLIAEIGEALTDGRNTDTEAFLLTDGSGNKIAGNIAVTPGLLRPTSGINDRVFVRDGRSAYGRVLAERLPDGSKLVVGRDLQDLKDFEHLVVNALLGAGVVAVLLAVVGAMIFREQLEQRVGAIRRTAAQIEAGDLTRRIPTSGKEDEFARLGHDINLMLDRIEALMEGVRHVSNTIAHNLRTPLSRIRSKLELASRPGTTVEQTTQAAAFAIREIEELTIVFDKLLQIAEAESGARRQIFQPVSLNDIVSDVVELYDPVAEEKGVVFDTVLAPEAWADGDRDLLASAIANLIDNAIKYAGSPARVKVSTVRDGDMVTVAVEDNGPGIAASDREKIGRRFFRLAPSVPGYGLGLASVMAIAHLHHARFELGDANPGLVVRLTLRCVPAT